MCVIDCSVCWVHFQKFAHQWGIVSVTAEKEWTYYKENAGEYTQLDHSFLPMILLKDLFCIFLLCIPVFLFSNNLFFSLRITGDRYSYAGNYLHPGVLSQRGFLHLGWNSQCGYVQPEQVFSAILLQLMYTVHSATLYIIKTENYESIKSKNNIDLQSTLL